MSEPVSPEDRYTQAQRVGELVELLRAFLAGHKDRAELARSTSDAWPLDRQDSPFQRHGAAHVVFQSVRAIEDRDGGAFVVRNQDVASYLQWLTVGDAFARSRDPLMAISTPIETLTSRTGGREVRMWIDGLGWQVSLRFGSPATGRCFVVLSPLSFEHARWSMIHANRGDDPAEAVQDVIESLAIEGPEVGFWHPQLEPAKMPRWTVWRQDDNGGRFEVDTFLAYSRAMRLCNELESRGHKQMYWVSRQGLPE